MILNLQGVPVQLIKNLMIIYSFGSCGKLQSKTDKPLNWMSIKFLLIIFKNWVSFDDFHPASKVQSLQYVTNILLTVSTGNLV